MQLSKTKYPFEQVGHKVKKAESEMTPCIGFEIEFAFDGLSQYFIRNSERIFGVYIKDSDAFLQYLNKINRHPIFEYVYKDGDNFEFCTVPLTKEVIYDIEPLMSFLFLKLKTYHFYVRPLSNIDLNFDADYYSPSDWENLFKFFYRNNDFLIFFSYRRQKGQDNADFKSLTDHYTNAPFGRRRKFIKDAREFRRNLEASIATTSSFCNVHARLGISEETNRVYVKCIEVKWFANPFNYKTILSYLEMIDCVVHFKRENKSNDIDDLYTFLSENCTKYKHFHVRVRDNPFGYLHGIDENTTL